LALLDVPISSAEACAQEGLLIAVFHNCLAENRGNSRVSMRVTNFGKPPCPNVLLGEVGLKSWSLLASKSRCVKGAALHVRLDKTGLLLMSEARLDSSAPLHWRLAPCDWPEVM
jgi:hypothetical protein